MECLSGGERWPWDGIDWLEQRSEQRGFVLVVVDGGGREVTTCPQCTHGSNYRPFIVHVNRIIKINGDNKMD